LFYSPNVIVILKKDCWNCFLTMELCSYRLTKQNIPEMDRGIREHLCRGGGGIFLSGAHIFLAPPLKTLFWKNIDTFFNYVKANYSIYTHFHIISVEKLFIRHSLLILWCKLQGVKNIYIFIIMILNLYLHWRQYWLKLF